MMSAMVKKITIPLVWPRSTAGVVDAFMDSSDEYPIVIDKDGIVCFMGRTPMA
jgi:hypothetical protein